MRGAAIAPRSLLFVAWFQGKVRRTEDFVNDFQHESSGEKDRPAPKAVVGRVSLYLRQLESARDRGLSTISSSQLGSSLSIGDAQVRKDLAYFGQFGSPGIGYPIPDLIAAIRHILGIDRVWPTALIGLGNLGRALLKYRGFRNRGFHIVALFDVNAGKIGQTHDDLIVLPLERLPETAQAPRYSLGNLECSGRFRSKGGRSRRVLRHSRGDELRPVAACPAAGGKCGRRQPERSIGASRLQGLEPNPPRRRVFGRRLTSAHSTPENRPFCLPEPSLGC